MCCSWRVIGSNRGGDSGLEKDMAWGRLDVKTGHVLEMNRDLVIAEVGRNGEMNMDLDR